MADVEEKAKELEGRLDRLLLTYKEIRKEYQQLEKEGQELGLKIRRAVDRAKMQKIKEHISNLNET